MRAPDLLVIGAMKSGTTTLFHDLAAHGSIALVEKESAGLESVDDPAGGRAKEYLRQWDDIASTPVTGEVNTTYAMAPHFAGVPERAAQLTPGAKILYIVREPIARIVSHHHHDVASGVVTSSIDEAVRTDPRFLDYSCYATQLALWRRRFSEESILVVRFEDYLRDRRTQANAIVAWLGLAPYRADVMLEEAHNISRDRRSARGLLRQVLHSSLYRKRLRPIVPLRFRRLGSTVLLPPAQPRPTPPTPETVRWLAASLADEVSELAAFTHGAAAWDLRQVVASYEEPDTVR